MMAHPRGDRFRLFEIGCVYRDVDRAGHDLGQTVLSVAVRSSVAGGDATGGAAWTTTDRKSVVSGKSVSVRVDLGGRRSIKKTIKSRKKTKNLSNTINTK